MKSLKQINGQPPEEFWLEYAAKAPVRERLRQAGVSFHSLGVAEDGSLSLGLHGPEIKDLSILKGFQVGHLVLGESVIRDLSPLKDLKTTTLMLDSSILDDLSSLRGTSLKVLRGMKSLKQINYHEVEDFWEAYDAGRFDDIQFPTWMFGWE